MTIKGCNYVLELLKKRRSIRRFKDIEVEKEKIDRIVKSALLSPSSRNIRPWEFIVVTDKGIIQELSKSKEHGSSFLKGAPLAIVVIADKNASDVWVEDASIASIVIQMEAEDIGLGSCWVQIRNRQHSSNKTSDEYVREVLNIPAIYSVESIIGIGYPNEQRPSYSDDELLYEKVFINKYGSKYTVD